MISNTPVCTPKDEEALRKDGSYPSGHKAIGWGWALILTELAPDRAEEILIRGRAFGESRNVCNAHWYSDVVAGRLVGAAAVAKLHASDEFREAMDAARADIERMGQEGKAPMGDCAVEARALSTERKGPSRWSVYPPAPASAVRRHRRGTRVSRRRASVACSRPPATASWLYFELCRTATTRLGSSALPSR
jgi:hypothetical protein